MDRGKVTYLGASSLIQRKIYKEDVNLDTDTIESFYNGYQEHTFIPVLASSLENKVLDVNQALLALVRRVNNHQVYNIAIVLRMGANPNLYVSSPEIAGVIHVLGYLYHRWKVNGNKCDGKTLNMIVLLFIHYGANPMREIFDKTGGGAKKNYSVSGVTVVEWLDQNGYFHILKKAYPDFTRFISPCISNTLAILTGDETLLKGKLPFCDVERIIKARTAELLCSTEYIKSTVGIDDAALFWSIDGLYPDAVRYYSNIHPSYPLLNTIIMKYRSEKYLIKAIYEEILSILISHGASLDTTQNVLLGDEKINTLYQVPRWKKSADQDNELAIKLGLEYRTNVKGQIEKIVESDPVTLKRSAINRQKYRRVAKHGYLYEFESVPPALLYANSFSIEGDPDDYNELSLTSYRDDNDDVWLFTSPNYEYILATGSNPITGIPLPQEVIKEIKMKLEYLTKNGMDPRKVILYSESIDELGKNDTVNDDVTNEKVNSMYYILAQYGLTRGVLSKITPAQIEKVLNSVGYIGNVEILTSSHAIITLAYIIDYYCKNEPDKILILANNLLSVSRNSTDQCVLPAREMSVINR